jgi:nicotinamide phosphoribosyltransferase
MDANGNISTSFKKSKGGRLKLVKTAEGYKTLHEDEQPELADHLQTVFENGHIMKDFTFEQVIDTLQHQ